MRIYYEDMGYKISRLARLLKQLLGIRVQKESNQRHVEGPVITVVL